MRLLNTEEAVRLLRSEVERSGGQSEWARNHRVSRTPLNLVLNGYRNPSASLLRALGLRKAYALGLAHPAGGQAARAKMALLNENDCVVLLSFAVERLGRQAEWARRNGVDRTFLNKVLRGEKRISEKILRTLKLRTVYVSHRR